MKRTCVSFSIIFGVVPEAISEWKPDSAPQAIVMNTNGNSAPANTGPSPLEANVRHRLVLHHRQRHDDADREQHDHADLHERREVVARREQHPHRQHRGDEAVGDQAQRERLGRERELVGEARVVDHAAQHDRREQQRHADRRRLQHAPGPQHAQVEAHEEGDRDRHRQRERAPRRLRQRVDHDEREDREQDDHDREHGDQRGRAADRPDLVARHLPERLAVAAHREEQDRPCPARRRRR